MVRTLTAKEKIYFILLLLPYTLLIILSAVWVTNSQGQPFASEHITAFILVIYSISKILLAKKPQ